MMVKGRKKISPTFPIEPNAIPELIQEEKETESFLHDRKPSEYGSFLKRITASTVPLLLIVIGICSVVGFIRFYRHSTQETLIIQHEFFNHSYSYIKSIEQLESLSSDIRYPDRLCVPDTNCDCPDPTVPLQVIYGPHHWLYGKHEENIKNVVDYWNRSQVIFYGDSITSFWIYPDNVDVFRAQFTREGGGAIDALALGIAGDRTEHLLYRLQNGELPSQSIHEPKIFWVLIGTNDFFFGCRPEVVLVGILSIIEELLLKQPKGIIVIQGILPRSISAQNGYLLYNGSYWRAIQAINEELKIYSNHRSRRVHYFDGADIFLLHKNSTTMDDELQLQIDEELMPDFLHPSKIGYQKWGEEILKKLKTIM